MRSFHSISCLVLILMTINSGLSRIKSSRSTKTSSTRKGSSKLPKTTISLQRGQLLYKGSRLNLPFNTTDESQVYAANYTMFPDELYYPRLNTVNDYEGFLGPCVNTTLELEANKEKLSKLQSDLYTRMTLRIIEFLCAENYNRVDNNACLCSSGFWVVTTVTSMLLAMNILD